MLKELTRTSRSNTLGITLLSASPLIALSGKKKASISQGSTKKICKFQVRCP